MMHHLIRFPHGFGDAVQLTVVLRHLAHYRPDWTIDVQARPGCETLYSGLAARSWAWEAAPDRRRYAAVHDLPWCEPADAWADSPSTKAERCLREYFRLPPVVDLCRYQIDVGPAAHERARIYMERVCGRLESRPQAADSSSGRLKAELQPRRLKAELQRAQPQRFPVVLIHYQGNSARRWKNIDERAVRDLCRAVRDLRLLPLVLDWNGSSGLAGRDGVLNAGRDDQLWPRQGIADGESLAALIGQARLMIGIDSGPGHVAGATDTPTAIVWTRHHPVQFYGLSPNVLHLVRANHADTIRGDRQAGLRFFQEHYGHRIYRDLRRFLPRLAIELLGSGPPATDGECELQSTKSRRPSRSDGPLSARLAICAACDQYVRGRCTMTGLDVRRTARRPESRCPMSRWPREAPPSAEPDELRGDLDGRSLLLRFPHGLGDHVQLTGVLAHLRRRYPRLAIDIACRAGTESLFAGLCRRAVTLGTEDAASVDLTVTLRWPEADAANADSPSTKAQRCLRDVFGINPLPALCRSFVTPPAAARQRAAEYLQRLCGHLAVERQRFPVVLFHTQGRCGRRMKDLDPDVLAACLEAVRIAGHVPIVLDWRERADDHHHEPHVINAAADRRLWPTAGVGDAATIAALAERATLCVGIDSGPGHLFAAVRGDAPSTPAIIVWRLLHPVNYFGLADHVTHFVPRLHGRFIRGRRTTGEAYFRDHYRHHEYTDLAAELPAAIARQLHADKCIVAQPSETIEN
jgi:ADP-heptose:LPS heptosyltransferase